MVSFGLDSCYTLFKNALRDYVRPETQVLACMGNHENMESFENGVTYLDNATATQRFKNALGYTDIDNHFVINGYHFILSSLLLTNGQWALNRNRAWVQEQLAIAAADDANKPIFTFNHFPVRNTTTYTSPQFQSYLNVARAEDVYVNYPQIVNITGHSHTPLTYPNIISQKDYTSVTAGSLNNINLEYYNEIVNGYSSQIAHNFYVEVDANNTIRIYPYDFTNNVLITDEPIEIKNPADKSSFKYTAEYFNSTYSAPAFAASAQIAISEIYGTSVKYSFPQASSSGTLYTYICELKKGSRTVQTWRLNSYSYLSYLGQTPATLAGTISGLEEKTEYTLVITPVDSFNNKSSSKLSVTFTTAKGGKTPWSNPNIKINVYDTLNSYADKVLTSSDYVVPIDSGTTLEFTNGQLRVIKNTSGTWAKGVLNYGNAVPDTTGATGLGFYFENNLSNSMYVKPCIYGNGIDASIIEGEPCILVDATTFEETEKAIGIYGTISLPAGFKGYVMVPFTSLSFTGAANITKIAIMFTTSSNKLENSNEYLLYDNFFIYGSGIEYNNEEEVHIPAMRAKWAMEDALAYTDITKDYVGTVTELVNIANGLIDAAGDISILPASLRTRYNALVSKLNDFINGTPAPSNEPTTAPGGNNDNDHDTGDMNIYLIPLILFVMALSAANLVIIRKKQLSEK